MAKTKNKPVARLLSLSRDPKRTPAQKRKVEINRLAAGIKRRQPGNPWIKKFVDLSDGGRGSRLKPGDHNKITVYLPEGSRLKAVRRRVISHANKRAISGLLEIRRRRELRGKRGIVAVNDVVDARWYREKYPEAFLRICKSLGLNPDDVVSGKDGYGAALVVAKFRHEI